MSGPIQRQMRDPGAGVAGKSGAEAADKGKVGWPHLRGLAQNLTRFGVDQSQTAARRVIGQPMPRQRRLQPGPIPRPDQRTRNQMAEAPEKLFVGYLAAFRAAAVVALHLLPDQVTQHGGGRLIPRPAGGQKARPKLGVAGEGRLGGNLVHAARKAQQG